MTFQVDLSEVKEFFLKVIKGEVSEAGLAWINQQQVKLGEGFQMRTFYLAFSSVPRFISKDKVCLTKQQIAEADQLRKGFQPVHWNRVQWIRTYLLLMLPHDNAEKYLTDLTRLFETADMDEQVALFGALPLLPHPRLLINRATDGIRTNITDVFDAIALHNPFPRDFLHQEAWNQMILKAVFMQRPLYRVYGADERANPELAGMLIDFAHERWAAGRQVWPEMWRFVGPYLNFNSIPDIIKVVEGDALEKQAGLLACAACNLPEAQKLLDLFPFVKEDIKHKRLNWGGIGVEAENKALIS